MNPSVAAMTPRSAHQVPSPGVSISITDSAVESDSYVGTMTADCRMVAIDLFCGGGGMTLGARQAGIKVVFAVERCPIAAATYHGNFPDIPIHVGDIRKLDSLPDKPEGGRDCRLRWPSVPRVFNL